MLYGADDLDRALSETVFHDVPVRGDKVVPLAKLRHRLAVALSSRRPLRLVDLTSDGLRCLELQRTELIDSDARSYEATARWARALHHHPDAFDGLYWVSRQHDTSRCILLFADRVSRDDLSVDEAVISITLGWRRARCGERSGCSGQHHHQWHGNLMKPGVSAAKVALRRDPPSPG